MLDIQKLINNKKNNKSHNPREINFIVKSYLNNKINNEDMTLWLKEIFDNGMSINETIFYTDAIINSGQKFHCWRIGMDEVSKNRKVISYS